MASKSILEAPEELIDEMIEKGLIDDPANYDYDINDKARKEIEETYAPDAHF